MTETPKKSYSSVHPRRFLTASRVAAGVVVGLLAGALMPASAAPMSATQNRLDAEAAVLYAEVMQAAFFTQAEARVGYASQSLITDTALGESEPRLEVQTSMALHDLTTTSPRVAFERVVRSYGEIVDVDPYRNETWGGIGTGAYGSGADGLTQAWMAVPSNPNPATSDLLAQVGDPQRVVGKAMATTDLSPRNRPHSVIEARLWSEHNAANPWGPLLSLSANVFLQVHDVQKEVRSSDGTSIYTITWILGYRGTLEATAYVTKNGILGLTQVHATFPRSEGEMAGDVRQEVRLTWIGGNAPMPGPTLTTEVRRASSLSRRAAAHAIPAIVDHASSALRQYAAENETTLDATNLNALVEALSTERPRWAAMGEEKANQYLNEWIHRYRVAINPATTLVTLTVEARVLQHSGVCEVPLMVIDARLAQAAEPNCDIMSLPVLGVDTLQPEDIARAESLSAGEDSGRTWGEVALSPETPSTTLGNARGSALPFLPAIP